MKGRKTAGIVIFIVGIIVIIVFALADIIGIGGGSFGPRQIGGTIAGVVIAAVGAFPAFKK
ncbi:MAG TPA: hypothetical protein ENI15_06485 [Spirochaetes bacterium]|nr:hypothetical protein [Spirochaetota bacterium]